MAEMLPLFPLSLAVFPGETLKLHIFEPRYQQLVQECDDQGLWFGIPPVIEQEMVGVATMVEIQSIDQRFPGGESNITVMGRARFKVQKFFPISPEKLYPGGLGEVMEEAQVSGEDRFLDLKQEILDLIFQLHDVLGIHKNVVSSPHEITAFKIAHEIGLSLRQEADLLVMNNEGARLNYTFDHLQKILPIVRETQRLKVRAQLNGHYKNLVPPNF